MTQSSNPQLQGRLTKALLEKACHSRALIWRAEVFLEPFGLRWSSRHFFTGLCCWQSASLRSWRAEVMYNTFFTLSLLRQPWLPLKTDKERGDRGNIYIRRKRGRQRETERSKGQAFQRKQGILTFQKKNGGNSSHIAWEPKALGAGRRKPDL